MSERVRGHDVSILGEDAPTSGRALVQHLLRRVDDGICEISADGHFRAVNDALLAMTGFDREALIGAPLSRLFAAPDRVEQFLETSDDNVLHPIDVEIATAGRDTLLCEVTMRPLSTETDVAGALAIVTELGRPSVEESEPISSSTVSVSIDADGQVLSVTPGIEDIFGINPEELLGDSLDMILDQSVEIQQPSVRSSDAIEAIGIGPKGAELDLQVTVHELESTTGAELAVTMREIGAARRNRFDVRDRTTKLGQIAENIEEIIWMSPPDKSWITYVNRAHEDIWGSPREELYRDPLSFLDSIHPDDRARVRDAIDQQKHGTYDEEYRVVQPDGSVRWVHDRAFPIRDATGSVYRVVGIAKDVTEQKRIAKELRQERDRMEGVLDASPIGILFIGENGQIPLANASATDIFGRSPDDIAAYLREGVSIVDESGEPIAPEQLPHQVVLESGECQIDQVLGIRTPTGERVWISTNASPHSSDEGVVLAIEDITDQRELESELDEVLGRISDAFYALDESWRFTHANDRAEELLEFPGDGLVGEHIWTAFEWTANSRIRQEFERSMQRQEAVTFEEYYPSPIDRWFEFNAYPSNSGLSVYFRDITERKADQQELSLFRTLLDHSNDSILIIDPESAQYLDINRTACERRGYSREEFLEKTVMDLSSEVTDHETWLEMVDELREEGAQTLEGRHLRKDGSTYPIEFSASYMEFGRGYVIAIGRDISERKRRERRLERSERQYRTIANNYPNGVVAVYDEELRITLAAGEIAGNGVPIGPQQEGEHIDDVLPDGVIEEIEPILRQTVDEGAEDSARASFGDRQWQLWTTPLSDADGEIFAGICFAQDISDRIERQRQLEASNRQLEQFAYAASHDLQEPLRMVSSYLQLIERRYGDRLDSDGQEFLEFAVDGADRMREMIDGLLEYSRVATHAESFTAVDMNAVLDDVLTDLHLQIEELDATITSEDLPPVYGDGGQLRQVLQNLIENALAYHGEEPPRIHVSTDRRVGRVAITVRDEGIGIPPDEQDRIFEVFQRLDPHERSGTGIGLPICRRIVDRHGGDISVDSTPGEGTAITVTLRPAGGRDE